MPAASIYVLLAAAVPGAPPIIGSAFQSEMGQSVRFAAITGFELMLLLAVIAAAGVLAYWRFRTHQQSTDDYSDEVPPLVFPVAAQPSKLRRPSAPQPRQASRPARTPEVRGAVAANEGSTKDVNAPPRKRARAKANGGKIATEEPTDVGDTTLQLMPGRLEVIAGEAGANEIRFVRPSGRDPVFTLGRSAGEAPAHVQLSNPTVSRMHASLRYKDGDWQIVNLSRTNPAVLNGDTLRVDAGERTLQDGDRLELGEIVLRFRCP